MRIQDGSPLDARHFSFHSCKLPVCKNDWIMQQVELESFYIRPDGKYISKDPKTNTAWRLVK